MMSDLAASGDLGGSAGAATKATGLALITLASGQFLMTLDTSVMNVSIATVAKDVGTDGDRDPDARSRSTRW